MLRFRNCPLFQYLILILAFLFSSFGILFFTEGRISKPALVSILIVAFGFSYFSNRITERLIEANFLERKLREELEILKKTLEIKVKARTKELEEEKISLEDRVKERTKELQKRIEELEKFHKLTVGRELKMVELKKEIQRLKEEFKGQKK